jgi:hypothetical protein
MSLKRIINEEISGLESNDKLMFPDDYTLNKTRVEYIYSMGANRPVGKNDEWYESKKIFEKKYRGIPVKMTQLLNKDGSERGWHIVSVGFDGDNIFVFNKVPQSAGVRPAIDNYYNKFAQYMDNIKINDNELQKSAIDLENKTGRKLKKIYGDDLFDTAVDWLIGNKINNRIQKAKVLKQLMNEGLPVTDAISFYQYIR